MFPKFHSKAFLHRQLKPVVQYFLRHLKTFNAVLRITKSDVKIMRFVLLMQKLTTTQMTCPILNVYAIVLIHEKHTINNKFRFCTTHFTLSLKYLYMKIFGKSKSVSGLHPVKEYIQKFLFVGCGLKKFDFCWYVFERRTKGYHIERRRN